MSKKQKKMLIRIIAAGAIWAIGFAVEHIFPTDDRFSLLGFIHLGIFTAAYLVIGWDILWKAIRNIAHGQVFDENFLMCIASIGAMVIGEYDEGGAVMILYQIGELFQSVAVGKSRRSIAEMVDINPEYANVERDGEVSEVSPEDVAAGETIVIRPGERIPLDGTVISGSSELNTAALTGESALRAVAEGDEVISGCINTNGLLKVKVSRPYSDSTVARILELVENSTENKAKPWRELRRLLQLLHAWKPVLLVRGAVPGGDIAVPDGSAAGAENRVLVVLCVRVYTAVRDESAARAHRRTAVRIFRLLDVQHILQPFPRGDSFLPASADRA